MVYQKDKITLRRWAEILIGEGKDSKAFSKGEETNLISFTYEICTRFEEGCITPKQLRKLAAMGNTDSEQVLSSTMLKNWETEGIVRRTGHGQYEFIRKRITPALKLADILKIFTEPK